jgi:serine/threonine protein kinase
VPGVALESFVGSGGQGWVYIGRIQATNKTVAVKVLCRGRDAWDWGAREAILCSRVRHRNVLRVLRAIPAGAFWVVVTELVVGDELDRSELPAADAPACFSQLADALAAIARQKLVHRDIKPANILLRRQDRTPVLIDFGLAIDLTERPADCTDLSGTPFFMPPEAWRDQPPTPAWDAYALGVTAAVALAKAPAMAGDLSSLRLAKLSGVFERRLVNAVPSESLRTWIAHMIAAEPEERLAAVESARGWIAA